MAVCFTGGFRTWDAPAVTTSQRGLIALLPTSDIFAYVTRDDGTIFSSSGSGSFTSKMQAVAEHLGQDVLFGVYEEDAPLSSPAQCPDYTFYVNGGGTPSYVTWQKIQRCFALVEGAERSSSSPAGHVYDWVVHARPDTAFFALPPSLPLPAGRRAAIYIHRNQDQFALCGRDGAAIYFNTIDALAACWLPNGARPGNIGQRPQQRPYSWKEMRTNEFLADDQQVIHWSYFSGFSELAPGFDYALIRDSETAHGVARNDVLHSYAACQCISSMLARRQCERLWHQRSLLDVCYDAPVSGANVPAGCTITSWDGQMYCMSDGFLFDSGVQDCTTTTAVNTSLDACAEQCRASATCEQFAFEVHTVNGKGQCLLEAAAASCQRIKRSPSFVRLVKRKSVAALQAGNLNISFTFVGPGYCEFGFLERWGEQGWSLEECASACGRVANSACHFFSYLPASFATEVGMGSGSVCALYAQAAEPKNCLHEDNRVTETRRIFGARVDANAAYSTYQRVL